MKAVCQCIKDTDSISPILWRCVNLDGVNEWSSTVRASGKYCFMPFLIPVPRRVPKIAFGLQSSKAFVQPFELVLVFRGFVACIHPYDRVRMQVDSKSVIRSVQNVAFTNQASRNLDGESVVHVLVEATIRLVGLLRPSRAENQRHRHGKDNLNPEIHLFTMLPPDTRGRVVGRFRFGGAAGILGTGVSGVE